MKTATRIFGLLLLFSLTTAAAYSQKQSPEKPRLFANFPETIQLSRTTLQNTFDVKAGQNVTVNFSNEFSFTGTVLSNDVKYTNLQSVLIKSPLFQNAVFHLSKITNADNSISYTGRIINANAFDGYEIKKDNSNNYRFQKFETARILQDCSY